jgi:hypothetical protein
VPFFWASSIPESKSYLPHCSAVDSGAVTRSFGPPGGGCSPRSIWLLPLREIDGAKDAAQKGQKCGISAIAITAQTALSGTPTRTKSVNR